MNTPSHAVGILGAGAWGTALAQVAARAGHAPLIWAREAEIADAINSAHENPVFLPNVMLDERVTASGDLDALAGCGLILAAAPAQHMRATLRALAPALAPDARLVLCAKGVEQGSLALMAEVAAAEAPRARIAVLSGPGFAKDVARGLPTAVTIACADPVLGGEIVALLGQPTFRPYLTDDLVGAEIGGAVKNVVAIACGVAEGRALGEGARAALITRGFAELTRLGLAMGARAETLNGLCGLGDLVLTCASLSSRNTSLGAALGEGRSLDSILGERRSVAEGVESAPAVVALADKHGADMPICRAVAGILAGAVSVDAAIEALLARPFRAEGA